MPGLSIEDREEPGQAIISFDIPLQTCYSLGMKIWNVLERIGPVNMLIAVIAAAKALIMVSR